MAYVSAQMRPALSNRNHGIFHRIREAFARYRLYNATARELSQLSDRDLKDIGISRCDIQSIARQSAYQF